MAAVDSELTLLYSDMANGPHRLAGSIPNPFFGRRGEPFRHPAFPIYLVTRLAAYDFDDIRALVDRALKASNRGRFVIDLADNGSPGDEWLRAAANAIPRDRVVLDATKKVLYDEQDVIAYAGWGSNDKNRHRRFVGFRWLPAPSRRNSCRATAAPSGDHPMLGILGPGPIKRRGSPVRRKL